MTDSSVWLFFNQDIASLRRLCSCDIKILKYRRAASANRRLLTEWWGIIFGENLILGSVRVEEQEVIEITDAVSQRANGEVFGCVGHEVPNHPFT